MQFVYCNLLVFVGEFSFYFSTVPLFRHMLKHTSFVWQSQLLSSLGSKIWQHDKTTCKYLVRQSTSERNVILITSPRPPWKGHHGILDIPLLSIKVINYIYKRSFLSWSWLERRVFLFFFKKNLLATVNQDVFVYHILCASGWHLNIATL